jgi:hypothetical protein
MAAPTPAQSIERSSVNNRTTLLVRLWLPDRPGALGAVASRIGSVGGDVHEIEVVDRGAGLAVDELVVTVPAACPLDLLAREIDEIDGVDIEEVVEVPTIPPDPRMQAFAAAIELASAGTRAELAQTLVDHARSEVRGDSVALVDQVGGRIIARSGRGGPDDAWLVAFARGVAESAGLAGSPTGFAEDVAWAVVAEAHWTVVTTRSGVALRDRERQIVQALAELAGRLLGALDD